MYNDSLQPVKCHRVTMSIPSDNDWPAPDPSDPGRERIIMAAREQLHLDDIASFSLDAVARRAGVTRMTVYNKFGSKAGLLEEVFDLLLERGAFREMPNAFKEPDVGRALDAFVGILGRFYTENRAVLVSLSAAAGQDQDLDRAMQNKSDRRRLAIETLIRRLGKERIPAVPASELVNTVDVLVTFNTFNALAGAGRTPTDVTPLVRQLLRSLLGLPASAQPSAKRGSTRKQPRRR